MAKAGKCYCIWYKWLEAQCWATIDSTIKNYLLYFIVLLPGIEDPLYQSTLLEKLKVQQIDRMKMHAGYLTNASKHYKRIIKNNNTAGRALGVAC